MMELGALSEYTELLTVADTGGGGGGGGRWCPDPPPPPPSDLMMNKIKYQYY